MKKHLLCTTLALIPVTAQATNGYFMHGSSITSQAMAGAGVTLPHDSIHAVANPANLVDSEERFDLGLNIFSPDRSAQIVGNGLIPEGSYGANGTSTFYMPQLGLVRHINDKLSYGVALYGNGGMNTTYKQNPFASFGAVGSGGVDLAQIFFTGSLGIKLTEASSLGLGITRLYQRFEAQGIQPFAGMSAVPGNVSNQGYDSATGWGVKIGFKTQVNDQLTLGANWNSSIDSSKFNKYRGLFAEQGDFDVPSSLVVGASFQVDPRLTLAVDWERINYSEVKAISNSNIAGGPLGADNGMGFGWQDMDVVKLGVEYQASESLTLRAGYSFADQPIPASQTFFNILAPGVVEKHLSLGGTWNISANQALTFAYTRAFENSVTGQNSIPPSFGSGEANLKMDQDLIGVTWTYLF